MKPSEWKNVWRVPVCDVKINIILEENIRINLSHLEIDKDFARTPKALTIKEK